jgi:hypothetical protein
VTAPPGAPPGAPFFVVPSSGSGPVPTKQADGPTVATESKSGKSNKHTKKVVLISIGSILAFIILVLALVLFIPRCGRRRERVDRRSRRHQIGAYGDERQQHPRDLGAIVQPPIQPEKGK